MVCGSCFGSRYHDSMIETNKGKQNFNIYKRFESEVEWYTFSICLSGLEDPASSGQVCSEEFQGMFNVTVSHCTSPAGMECHNIANFGIKTGYATLRELQNWLNDEVRQMID